MSHSSATATNRTGFMFRTSDGGLQLMIPTSAEEAGRQLAQGEKLYLMDEFPTASDKLQGCIIGWDNGFIMVRALDAKSIRQQLLRFLSLQTVNNILLQFVSTETRVVNIQVSPELHQHIIETIGTAVTTLVTAIDRLREQHRTALRAANPTPGRKSVIPMHGILGQLAGAFAHNPTTA
ncbi:MAG: hypothetical protein ACQR33_02240 [Candidatus Saccharibacteria bacterium]